MTEDGTSMDRSIALIGMRGSGKTTVGRILAERLGREFIDTDEEVVRRSGQSIAQIFAVGGERAFRDLERDVIADICANAPGVISVGGGAVLDEANVTALKSVARVVRLVAPLEELLRRIESDPDSAASRPPLTDQGQDRRAGESSAITLSELRQLAKEREEPYAAAAEITIDTENRTPEEVAELIEDNMRK